MSSKGAKKKYPFIHNYLLCGDSYDLHNLRSPWRNITGLLMRAYTRMFRYLVKKHTLSDFSWNDTHNIFRHHVYITVKYEQKRQFPDESWMNKHVNCSNSFEKTRISNKLSSDDQRNNFSSNKSFLTYRLKGLLWRSWSCGHFMFFCSLLSIAKILFWSSLLPWFYLNNILASACSVQF